MEEITLFNMEDKKEHDVFSNRLEVVQADFITSHAASWQELFAGFDEIYAITYSAGIGFIYQLLQQFEQAEIIFGCEAVINYSIAEVMAFQNADIQCLRKDSKIKDYLTKRIDAGNLRLYIAREKLSHEKIYMLKAQDGRKRVIMGSANMSHSAFAGNQRENICYFDGDAAFDWYMACFRDLLAYSTDDITKQALVFADTSENIDRLPIAQHAKVKKIMIIEPKVETDAPDKIKYILDLRNQATKLAPLIPKDKKGGKVVLSSDKIVTIRRRATEQNQQEKEAREEYPRLIVDCETKAAYLNDYPLDLHPSDEEIEKDIKIFVRYMQGFEKFPGDTVQKQRRYFEFAAWFFATPFLAVLRNTAAKNGKNHLSYPIFGLLCGSSKAGKTTFLETLLKMMIGQKIKISAPKFTRTGIDSLRKLVKGAPIIVDDLTSKRFNDHATETIKYDDFGLLDNDILYPAVVISANEDVKVASHELVRRTVVCHVQGGLKTIDSMKSNIVSRTQNHMGTALYREYLRIMLRKMPDALDWLKSQDENAIPPDIFMLSSATLCSIFLKHNGELPHYVRKLTSRDYFDEKVTGANAIKKIRTAWIADRESFVIDKRRNELRYNVGQTYEAERLRKELPEDLEASRAKDWVIMRLDTSKKFFGLDFRRGFFR